MTRIEQIIERHTYTTGSGGIMGITGAAKEIREMVEKAIPAEEECGRFENAHLQSKADGRNEVISEIRKNLGLDK